LKRAEVGKPGQCRAHHQPATHRGGGTSTATSKQAGDEPSRAEPPAALDFGSADKQPTPLAARSAIEAGADPPAVGLEQHRGADESHALVPRQPHRLGAGHDRGGDTAVERVQALRGHLAGERGQGARDRCSKAGRAGPVGTAGH
jgi:hypothetical protein